MPATPDEAVVSCDSSGTTVVVAYQANGPGSLYRVDRSTGRSAGTILVPAAASMPVSANNQYAALSMGAPTPSSTIISVANDQSLATIPGDVFGFSADGTLVVYSKGDSCSVERWQDGRTIWTAPGSCAALAATLYQSDLDGIVFQGGPSDVWLVTGQGSAVDIWRSDVLGQPAL
ncbi:MAG TPA: hypothetical protein VIA06_17485 [Candidatus Dormibacteraeota bacterium]|nr:hypothetical protein [Candidatus Dormibacteraeota bacterium]